MSTVVGTKDFNDLVEDQTQIFTKINELEVDLKKHQAEINDTLNDSGAEVKEQINKAVNDMADTVKKINESVTQNQERLDNMEKEYQDRVKFSMSTKPASVKFVENIYSRIDTDEKDAGLIKTVSDEQIMSFAQKGNFNAIVDGDPRDLIVPQKALITSATGSAGSAGPLQVPEYQERIQPPGQQEVTLLNYLPMSMTNRSEVHWRQEKLTARTDGFGVQSIDFTGDGQGTALGESDFQFEDFSARTRTFGHHTDIAIQIIQDQPQLQSYIEGQMMYMVRYNLENQVLYGNPSQPRQWDSFNSSASNYDTALVNDLSVASPQKYDVLRLVKLQGDKTFFPTTLFVMNTDDHASLQLTKDNQGRYLFADSEIMMPWGVPVVKSYQFTAGSFFGLPLPQIELCVRRGWDSGISFENNDNFEKLIVTLRIYGRYALKMYRPNSITKGTFAAAVA